MPLMPRPTQAEAERAMARLGLQPDGTLRATPASVVGPVLLGGREAYLKITHEPEELVGARALEQWDGSGAVRVLIRDGNAVVLERAGRTLLSSVRDDVAATRVLCSVADRLQARNPMDLGGYPSLRSWFSSLFADTTPRFDPVRVIADQLLDRVTPQVLLHGDLHHENVLAGADRGWLAIDPKGIVGPREFDYCNLFTNWAPGPARRHFDTRLHTVAATAAIDPVDLLRWIASWSALSGIWHLEDGDVRQAAFPHSITDLALDRLQAHSGSASP